MRLPGAVVHLRRLLERAGSVRFPAEAALQQAELDQDARLGGAITGGLGGLQAALEGTTLSDCLLREVRRAAERPSPTELRERLRQ